MDFAICTLRMGTTHPLFCYIGVLTYLLHRKTRDHQSHSVLCRWPVGCCYGKPKSVPKECNVIETNFWWTLCLQAVQTPHLLCMAMCGYTNAKMIRQSNLMKLRILTHPSPIVDVCWMNEPSRTWLLCLMETGAVTLWDMTRVSTLFAIVSRS